MSYRYKKLGVRSTESHSAPRQGNGDSPSCTTTDLELEARGKAL